MQIKNNNKKQKNTKIAISLMAVSSYIFAYANTFPGLDSILEDTPSPQNIQTQSASEIPTLNPIPIENTPTDSANSTAQPTTVTPSQPAVIESTLQLPSDNPTTTESSTSTAGSVFIFPLPLDKISLPPKRPSRFQNEAAIAEPQTPIIATTTASSGEITSIIAEAEIQELLGDGPSPDSGPNHQVVRMKGEYVPLAPPRPIESILAATADSQPIIVDAPLNITEGILLSSQPNPAQTGQATSKIVIHTPPARPQGLRTPEASSLPPIEDSIATPTINSGGRLNIKYKSIRYQKLGSCSIRDARQVTAVGQASVLPAAVVLKDFSVDLARFERDVLQPAARRHYGVPVTQIKHLSAFRCTNIAGTRNLSEHSKGNALDVSSFVFADGRSVDLIKGWRGTRREQKFLRELQAGACKIFGTTLTPNYNKAHYNHFHFDGKSRKSKPICN